jgi:hypothetical protein
LRWPLRGGNWNNGTNAGVFYLNLNNPRSNSNGNIGFRSALPCSQMLYTYRVYSQNTGVKDSISFALCKKKEMGTNAESSKFEIRNAQRR